NQEESDALGFPFPPLSTRFQMLEETLQIAHAMWQGANGSQRGFHGELFQAKRLLNSPQSLSRPRPPIMVGGGGEQKTLRLVARYADACNLFATTPAEVSRKLGVLRAHCDAEGRDYDAIAKTALATRPGLQDPTRFAPTRRI